MIVAIAVPVLAEGDAIGNDALGMAVTLRMAGHHVQFFAEKSLTNEEVLPLTALAGFTMDTLIYHHSHGCDPGVTAALNCSGRAIVKYHNVTPAKYFPGGSEVQTAAKTGLMQAARLARANVRFWVDSPFNAQGLNRACDTLPPFMQTETLLGTGTDADTASAFDTAASTVLMVGRVAPNKNLLLALDAFAVYRRSDPNARLIIAGGHVYEEYSDAVTQRIRDRELQRNVIVTGRVTVSQLKTLYLAADALLVTSEHEGFCVPLVEAMALTVPVVAVKATAVPDTAGDAAMLVEADADAIAGAMKTVIGDRLQRENLLLNGQRRYRTHFDNDRIERRFLQLFESH